MSRRDGPLLCFALPPAGITVTTLRKQIAAFRAAGVKVGVKLFRAAGASIDLACSNQRVAVVLAASVDRLAADYALGHRSVPKGGRAARRGRRAARREQYNGMGSGVIGNLANHLAEGRPLVGF